jgi:predicted dehydrogenase
MNVGIIGAGGIAQKLHLPQIAAMPGLRVTHLSGRKESRLRSLAERFDIRRWSTDHRELLADDTLEGIILALPHPLHVPVGLQVLAADKHLMMQKPLCGDLAEADAFVAAVERSDRTVLVLPHFAPEIYRTRDLIADGAIGRPSGAHCRTSHGGPEVYYAEVRDGFGEPPGGLWFFDARQASVGALFDMGVYAVAALVAALGAARRVTGMTATLDKPTELEDAAALILQLENGALATAETSWCDPARTWQLRVHGTRGKITIPGHEGASMTRWEPGSYTREDIPPVPHAVDAAPAARGNVHEHWLTCIREGRHPELSHAWAARHVTEILLAGLESSRTGRAVDLHTRADPPAGR